MQNHIFNDKFLSDGGEKEKEKEKYKIESQKWLLCPQFSRGYVKAIHFDQQDRLFQYTHDEENKKNFRRKKSHMHVFVSV